MKKGFSMITAIAFMVLVATMSMSLLQSSKEQYSMINSEYMRAQAKSAVRAAAHTALSIWLRRGYDSANTAGIPAHNLCNQGTVHINSNTFYSCGSLVSDWNATGVQIQDEDGYLTDHNITSQLADVLLNPLNVGGSSMDIYLGGGGSSSNYLLRVNIKRLINQPRNAGNKELKDTLKNGETQYTYTTTDSSGKTTPHVAIDASSSTDYVFARDLSTADFVICASTDGGNVDKIAPAGYCERFTFSN